MGEHPVHMKYRAQLEVLGVAGLAGALACLATGCARWTALKREGAAVRGHERDELELAGASGCDQARCVAW